jgi:hypothetical protein
MLKEYLFVLVLRMCRIYCFESIMNLEPKSDLTINVKPVQMLKEGEKKKITV